MEQQKIFVQSALMPRFCKDFRCIMGDCQNTCCSGWKIEFNKKDYLAIKRAPKSKELEELVEQGMHRLREREHDGMYAEFPARGEDHCFLQTPEGLCRLQLECGADTLPKVCRVYPRTERYTTAGLERSLSLTCEGVLSLLWDLKDGIDFVEEPLSKEECKVAWTSNPAEIYFAAIQELWIDTLQNRALPLPKRMLVLGMLTRQLRELDWNDGKALDHWLASWKALLQQSEFLSEELEKMPRNRQMFMSNNIHVLVQQLGSLGIKVFGELSLPIIGTLAFEGIDWSKVTINAGRYQELEDKLDALLSGSEHFFENLMVSAVFMMAFPNLDTPEDLWRSYVNLCNVYSFYRFTSVCAMDQEQSRERLFHILVRVGRSMLHNRSCQAELQSELFRNDSATLAHMAILVSG